MTGEKRESDASHAGYNINIYMCTGLILTLLKIRVFPTEHKVNKTIENETLV